MSDNAPEHALDVRYEQKMNKYARVADEYGLQLVPALFSHADHKYTDPTSV